MSFSDGQNRSAWPWLLAGFSSGLAAGYYLACQHWNPAATLSDKKGGTVTTEAVEAPGSPPSGNVMRTPSGKHTATDGSPMRAYALRVPPGAELKSTLMSYVEDRNLGAVCVVTCVGSLKAATLRMAGADRDSADADHTETRTERFEILSLVGTLSTSHGCHLHISLGDSAGKSWGGHCVGGMTVNTTAEVVLAECEGLSFERHYDYRTGFKELCVLCGPISGT